jgi:Aldehyde dehydrogenase family
MGWAEISDRSAPRRLPRRRRCSRRCISLAYRYVSHYSPPSASVWTRDTARARAIARLEVGSVNFNDIFANLFGFAVPQSGWKQSGIGHRVGGADGIRKYCRLQSIAETRRVVHSMLIWYPYTARRGRRAARILRLLTARDPRRRLGLR